MASKVTRTAAVDASPRGKVLTEDNVFVNLRKMEYVVCEPLHVRALEIEEELQKGIKKPFKEVIKVNMGDAHAMGQQPITFLRQVLTLTVLPDLLNDPRYPEDAKDRARMILRNCLGGSVGSLSEAAGIEYVRKHVVQYIQERDGGILCDYRNIILSNGASDGIRSFLNLFSEKINNKPSGVLIPIPQYPLYSEILTEFDLAQIGYYLDEDNKWSLEISELERALEEVKGMYNPRVLVVINPGNPTGQVLTRKNIENVIRFAHKHHLFLLADEVCQDNIYDKNSAFHSFKKVMTKMGEPYSKMELASFMSISKGYMGECGIRGGYAEIINMDPEVMKVLLKWMCVACPTVLGQVAVDVVMNPPRPNEPSYEQFLKEKNETLRSVAERSHLVVDTLNSIPGYKANPTMGAIYVFPRLELPLKAIEAARAKDQEPDVFYTFKLLESTGIYVIPGSSFGQKSGTNHFRITILPQKETIKIILEALKQFHIKFLKDYS